MGSRHRPLAALCATGALAAAAAAQETLHIGTCIESSLAPGASREFVIEATPDDEIHIEATARDFVPVLILRGQGLDTRCEGRTARVSARTHLGGSLRLRVRAAQPAHGGPFRLSLTSGGPLRLPVSPGQSIHGSLRPGDMALLSGELCDQYTLDGRAGQQVVIQAVSNDFDPFLTLRFPSGGQVDDDDSAGAPNAQITRTLPQTGQYLIEVTTLEIGQQGTYVLHLR